jgi:hypothetical protein
VRRRLVTRQPADRIALGQDPAARLPARDEHHAHLACVVDPVGQGCDLADSAGLLSFTLYYADSRVNPFNLVTKASAGGEWRFF